MQNFGRGMWRRIGDYDRLQTPQVLQQNRLQQYLVYIEYQKALKREEALKKRIEKPISKGDKHDLIVENIEVIKEAKEHQEIETTIEVEEQQEIESIIKVEEQQEIESIIKVEEQQEIEAIIEVEQLKTENHYIDTCNQTSISSVDVIQSSTLEPSTALPKKSRNKNKNKKY